MLTVLWALWLHQNEMLFRGRTASAQGGGPRTWRDSWHPGSVVGSREVEYESMYQ